MDFLDAHYYSNVQLFEKHKHETIRYDAVFIDEAQDYKKEWMDIIKNYFLKANGEFVIFCDEKQNLYGRQLEADRTIRTNIRSKWNELEESFRLPPEIIELAYHFQKELMAEKYNLDEIKPIAIAQSFFDAKSYISYSYYESFNANSIINEIYSHIRKLNIHSNDVCIISGNIRSLRSLDTCINKNIHEKTETLFETEEEYSLMFRKVQGDLNCSVEDWQFKKELDKRLERIRKNRKYNFWMNRGMIKLSTTHSFKGWEIRNLVLLIDKTSNTTEELVYTGLTRSMKNLLIINVGNAQYNNFFGGRRLNVLLK